MITRVEGTYFRAVVLSGVAAAVYAFQAAPIKSRVSSSLKATVDPTTITTKEYQDICGVSFDNGSLQDRLKFTNFLYPKHVEVIEDIGPIAGAMVDNMVSLTQGNLLVNLSTPPFYFKGSQ